ncbi:sigma-70 family RNA polymerase sigma factor, partial [bacterium]|nr:sigma-70 family RNA polymerase sigma factor [bacterium]
MQCEITDIKHDLMKIVESGCDELNFLDENDWPATVPSSIKQLDSGKPVMEQRKFRFLPTEPQLHRDKKKVSPNLEQQIYSTSTNDSYAYQEDDFVPNYSDKEDSIFNVYLHQIRQIPQLSKSQETSLFIKIEKNKKIIQDSISELKSIFPDIKQDWELLSVSEIEQSVENLLDYDSQKYTDANMRHYSQYLIDIIARSRKQIQIAKNQIIESNLRLVVYIAQKYNARGLTLSDLIQEGNTGLMTAVDRYEYQRGAKFSAYAS